MEQLVNRAASLSDLASLRMLQMIHQQTTSLVEDLKLYELPSITPRSPIESADFNQALNGSSAASAGFSANATTVSTMLETATEELFVPYTEGQRYLEKESKSLGELYANYLTAFARYHVRKSCLSLHYPISQSIRI